ncbi:CATRA system-associated protein [Streptomyces globisporus]
MHPQASADDRQSGITAEARNDLLGTLDAVVRQRLLSEQWEDILTVLERASAAVDAGNDAGVYAATGALQLLGTPRTPRIGSGEGSTPVEPPPKVHERTNYLKHSLRSQETRGAAPRDDAHGDGRDDGRRTSS